MLIVLVSFMRTMGRTRRGRVFKWYSKAVLRERLKELGFDKSGCKTGAQLHDLVDEGTCVRAAFDFGTYEAVSGDACGHGRFCGSAVLSPFG